MGYLGPMWRETLKVLIAVAAGVLAGYGGSLKWRSHGKTAPGLVVASPMASQKQPPSTVPRELRQELQAIKQQVEAQAELLARQARMLDELTGARRSDLEAKVKQCEQVQNRLEQQLEACLFAKAELERSLARKSEASSPTVRVEETIEHPGQSSRK